MDSAELGRAFVTAVFTGSPLFETTPPVAPVAPTPHEGAVVYNTATRTLPEPCSVCLEPMRTGDRIGTMVACLANGAMHVYHHRCIAPWYSLHESCPLCRST